MKTPPPITPLQWTPEQQALLDSENFDEAIVGPYDLPAALNFQSGEKVKNAQEWAARCAETLELFQRHIYGNVPRPLPHTVKVVEEGEAYGGLAVRRQIEIGFEGWDRTIDLILYRPKAAAGPVPCFLGLAFFGNEANFSDPAVRLCRSWMRAEVKGFESGRSSEAMRGSKTSRWPVEEILARGYGLATAYYGDIEPDYSGGHEVGVRSLFAAEGDDAPQAIGTWAWGLSRLMDYLESVPEIDAGRVILTGHSRLGKTALWAAATDERFAGVISNNSGCGGASIGRRNFGETLYILSNVRRYWFCPRCAVDSTSDATMPVDQHQLLATIAPRPVLIASAEDDGGADPRGEFLSARHASEVYELLGAGSLGATSLPPLNTLTGDRLCYYIRPGEHDIKPEDWRFHLQFADRYFQQPNHDTL